MTDAVQLPFGLTIGTNQLAELLLDKLMLGSAVGIVLAVFGYWLNRRLKDRDRDYERAKAAIDIRVAAATKAVDRVTAAGDAILVALGTLSADVRVLRQAGERLAAAALTPRPDVAPDLSWDDAWVLYADELSARIKAVLSATRFASQTDVIAEAIRREMPEWAMRVLILDQEMLESGAKYQTLDVADQFAARDMSDDLSKLLIRACLSAEAAAKLEPPVALLRAAVRDASTVLMLDNDIQAFQEYRAKLLKAVENVSRLVLSLAGSPELAGPFGLAGDAVYATRDLVLLLLANRTARTIERLDKQPII